MDKQLCIMCSKPLVKIGLARNNKVYRGKCHRDWSTRKLHKKCLQDYCIFLNTQIYSDQHLNI